MKRDDEIVCEDKCDGDDYLHLDLTNAGELLDYHMEIEISEEEIAKRFYEAVERAKEMGGNIPSDLEEAVGIIAAPRITWQDVILNWIAKKKYGVGKSDWTIPQNKPLFAGLFIPEKKSFNIDILVAYDCSASMSRDDVGYGLGQLLTLSQKNANIWLLPWDTQPHYNAAKKLEKININTLQQTKLYGRGGTIISSTLNSYEKELGHMDIVIIITDGGLYDFELQGVKQNKNTKYLWLITSHIDFKPPIGRVIHIRNE